MSIDKVVIGSDHAGYALKKFLIESLLEVAVEDMGTFSEDSTDYADYGHAVAHSVVTARNTVGIVICGSGNGINMTANKRVGIRSALCWNSEVSKLAREHNNANVLAIPSRFVSFEEALDIVNIFLSTEFEGGRHQRRIEKIDVI